MDEEGIGMFVCVVSTKVLNSLPILYLSAHKHATFIRSIKSRVLIEEKIYFHTYLGSRSI